MIARTAESWMKDRESRHKVANWYDFEAKPFRDVEKMWQAAFADLKKGGSLVIPIVHDISFDFVPRDNQRQFLTVEEACAIMGQISAAGSKAPIDIILHTLGGDALAAEMVADALKSHKGPVRAYVPYIAMSAGTMIALAAKELHMGSTATLGPIDTQYWGFPADAWKHLEDGGNANGTNERRPVEKDHMFMLAYLVKKRSKEERDRAKGLLNEKYKASADKILDGLLDPSHHGERFKPKDLEALGVKPVPPVDGKIRKFVDLRLRMLELFPKHMTSTMMSEQTQPSPPAEPVPMRALFD
jgi:ClpP class serine protease